ncbi:MAG: glutamine--tRNA ligase/YqeY domain fusion protein [Candidatus Zapsychrus exili]|nr:glutamine--tRNA ligase/YqeY domain fusion protein [Candidatus Zapsychrus exili]
MDNKDTNNKNSLDFIRARVKEDVSASKNDKRVITRFPPEPNGYLHIGHAKAICLNFGIAKENDAVCHLRFDDTNPTKEEQEYVDSIIEDVKWLGFDWGNHLYYASDYFDRFYEFALQLIEQGKAYIDDLNAEQIREHRGTLTDPGKDSPCRNRPVHENLDLFHQMRAGEFNEGDCVLRAKINMSSPNLNMRDPIIYRILKADHHRTKDNWCIYPMYDFAHSISDSIEGITHSICTLEFENHRPLYEWFLEELNIFRSKQIEFARLNLSYTILSKRKLLQLVEEKHVSGWDDPRMPTISGLRRRGYSSASIREFCSRIGVAKFDSLVDKALLEYCLREDLNKKAERRMAVLKPLKVVITNYPQDKSEELDAINNPEDETAGSRTVLFSKEIYIEQDDFLEDAPKKFFRLSVGREVRLRYAYFVTCQEVIKDPTTGEIIEIRCTYDPETKGGNSPDGRKVKGTIHWVSAEYAIGAKVRLYDNLFLKEDPNKIDEGKDFKENLNLNSIEVLEKCFLEPSLKDAKAGEHYQFERLGYFCVDSKDSTQDAPVFNRTSTLRDAWVKIQKK